MDRAEFEMFFKTHQSRVYNTALAYVQNVQEAEEVTQDVFIELYHSYSAFKGESTIQTWIYRITINKSLDHIRHRKRKKRFGFLVSLLNSETGEPTVEVPDFHHPGVIMENH